MVNKHQTTTDKSACSWALPKPKSGVTDETDETDETSHPLVFLCHMVPILPTEQNDVTNTTGRSKHRA